MVKGELIWRSGEALPKLARRTRVPDDMRRAIPPRVSAPKWLVQAGSDSWRNWTPCNANRRISHACPTRPGWAQVFLSVPDLTRRTGIKLNDRVWLRGCSERVFVSHRTISPSVRAHHCQSRQAIIFRLAALLISDRSDL